MGIGSFERRVEGLVEGTFARLFRSGLEPVEIGRKLEREMDSRRSIGVSGATLAPNQFTIELAASDAERLADISDSLRHELAEAAREHARDEGYGFLGPLDIEFTSSDERRTGTFRVDGRLVAGEHGTGAGSLLLPTGQRVLLGEFTVTIGRLPECTITVGDQNVSRQHAEIRPRGTAFVLLDLGSTNGTFVNDRRIAEHELRDGDELRFGATVISFDAS